MTLEDALLSRHDTEDVRPFLSRIRRSRKSLVSDGMFSWNLSANCEFSLVRCPIILFFVLDSARRKVTSSFNLPICSFKWSITNIVKACCVLLFSGSLASLSIISFTALSISFVSDVNDEKSDVIELGLDHNDVSDVSISLLDVSGTTGNDKFCSSSSSHSYVLINSIPVISTGRTRTASPTATREEVLSFKGQNNDSHTFESLNLLYSLPISVQNPGS